METSECDFYEVPFRRVPANSATTQKELIDYSSIVTFSTYNIWSKPLKRTMTTTYIDGARILGNHDCSYDMRDIFPKGKNRPKPLKSAEKKVVIVSVMEIYFEFCLIFIYRIPMMHTCHYYQQMHQLFDRKELVHLYQWLQQCNL